MHTWHWLGTARVFRINGAGSVIRKEAVVSHPLSSVIVTAYVPGQRLKAALVPCPFGGTGFHRNWKLPVPPVGFSTISPSHAPAQLTMPTDAAGSIVEGPVINTVTVVSQR